MKHDVSSVSPDFLRQRIEEARERAAMKEEKTAEPISPGDNGHNHFGPDGEVAEKPLRPMPSWIDYSNREIDRSQYHIGEGFLEIGGFVMLIGQSYVGKSTLLTQISINAAIGRDWLFFRFGRPLKIITVQAEDSANKLVKMGQMSERMGLTEEQIKLAGENTSVLTIRDLQDVDAIREIERHALVVKPDVLCINPMTSYLSGGVYKDELINRFLRVQLTPMLDRLKMSGIVLHQDRKSTRLNSSHTVISYAVFCLKKKKKHNPLDNASTHGTYDATS